MRLFRDHQIASTNHAACDAENSEKGMHGSSKHAWFGPLDSVNPKHTTQSACDTHGHSEHIQHSEKGMVNAVCVAASAEKQGGNVMAKPIIKKKDARLRRLPVLKPQIGHSIRIPHQSASLDHDHQGECTTWRVRVVTLRVRVVT